MKSRIRLEQFSHGRTLIQLPLYPYANLRNGPNPIPPSYILPPPPPWPSRFGAQQKIVSVLFKTEEEHSVFCRIFEPDVIAYRCSDL